MSEAPLADELQVVCASQVNPEDATPMMRQYIAVKNEHPGVVVLYRMGDFYETFFEDAVIAARALEITLTGRDAGKLGRVPMAGIPVRSVNTYLQKLIEQNFKVAICEQVEDPAQAKGLVERRVTRILSSGTLADQAFLKGDENNFLGACWFNAKQQQWGFAYCDVTTGEFLATQLSPEQFMNELDRVKPAELLVTGKRHKGIVVDEWVPDVPGFIKENYQCTPLRPQAFEHANGEAHLKQWFSVQNTLSFGLDEAPNVVCAVGAILSYIEDTYLEDARPVFEAIRFYHVSEQLEMNAAARHHLELTHTVKDGRREGSLLWVLNKTCTNMGNRLLHQWVQGPSISLPEIQSRLDAVEALVNQQPLRSGLQQQLPGIYDMERLAMKVHNLSAMPRDLLALKQSCEKLPVIAELLYNQQAFYLAQAQAVPAEIQDFTALLDKALSDTPPVTLKEGGVFQSDYDAELHELRRVLEGQESWRADYEAQERERTGIKTLKLNFNNAFGYFIEISKAMAKQAPEEYHRKQTLTNAERFITPELKAHEEAVYEAQNKLYELEYQLFIEFRETLLQYAPALKEMAHRIAVLDVLQSLAHVAVENQYTRPQVDDSLELTLQEARHPVVETMLPMGVFVSNDCKLSAKPKEHQLPQVMMISGPNMSGKSTYMRQVALIVLMAQMGSFVPASYARIGLVDQLFTRIGAVDDLSTGQSTFMVEMTETAHILNCATERSLVLLDEVGRGTSTYDGVSIAWGVTEYLANHNQCRTLFATHYHELNTMEELNPRIQNFRVMVSETEGDIDFLYQVAPGAAQKSYGIQVAKMAGLPASVIQKAERLLNKMQENEFTSVEKKRKSALLETSKEDQLTLFASVSES